MNYTRLNADRIALVCLLSGIPLIALPAVAQESYPPIASPEVGHAAPNLLAQVPAPSSLSSIQMGSESTKPALGVNAVSDLVLEVPGATANQVTSVSQLSDVRPTDWAFQALQSLVEKYGCIAGYPDGTFRGNRAATRFELAAALNACLDVISDRFATKEDLATVRKLQEDLAAELATLRGRVDGLEARTAKLEAQQFSTTTKLQGENIVAFEAAGGGGYGFDGVDVVKGEDPNPIVVYRTRLNLVTSFSGKDALITGLQAFNFGGGLIGGSSVQNTLFPGTVINSGSTNLSFQPQFAGVDPQFLGSGAYSPNTLALYKLLYVFPIAGKFTGFVFPKAETTDAFPQIIPWASEGQGALSRFAGVNPITRLSGGTSGVGLASGLGFIWNPNKTVNLTALYGSVTAPVATVQPGVTALGSGFFPNDENSFIAAAQATFKPLKSFDAAFNFAYAQHALNILGTGLSSNGLLGALGAGGGDIFTLPGLALDQRVQLFGVGGTFTYRITPKIALSGYGAGIFVNAVGGTSGLSGNSVSNVKAGATYTSFMGGVYFQDALLSGNTAAFIVGQPLYLESATGIAGDADEVFANGTRVFNKARPFQVEAYYRFKVNDNISVTPGAFVIFNPESNSENNTTAVGLVRTTFTF